MATKAKRAATTARRALLATWAVRAAEATVTAVKAPPVATPAAAWAAIRTKLPLTALLPWEAASCLPSDVAVARLTISAARQLRM